MATSYTFKLGPDRNSGSDPVPNPVEFGPVPVPVPVDEAGTRPVPRFISCWNIDIVLSQKM